MTESIDTDIIPLTATEPDDTPDDDIAPLTADDDIDDDPSVVGLAITDSVVVGGVEYAGGSWGEHAAAERAERWRHAKEPVAAWYPGRTFIGGADAADSLLATENGTKALEEAAKGLEKALVKYEESHCDPDENVWNCGVVVPAIFSNDVQDFLRDKNNLGDEKNIRDLVGAASDTAAVLGKPFDVLPAHDVTPIPLHTVPTGDDEAVLKLESDTIPYVKSFEKWRNLAAERLSQVADVVEAVAN